MKPHTGPALFLLACLILPGTAQAQAARMYNVELILFTELNPSSVNAEHWPEDPGQPQIEEAIPLTIGDERVQSLDPSAYRLSGIWSALKNSRDYRPIRHLAWQQPGLKSSRTPLVAIGDGSDSEIQGTAKVSLARFLHLSLDLVLNENGKRYRLKLARRMRSNELHYLDHPMFGAIAIITPQTQ